MASVHPLAACCVLGVVILAAGAAGQQIVVSEQLDRGYAHELLYYPFAAPEGACRAESLRVTGPDGPAPAQLTAIVRWPGTEFVKSAKLALGSATSSR